MNPSYFLLPLLLLGACAGPHEHLVVKQFQLRDQALIDTEEPMVKMEKERRLHGAVSMAQRRNKLGQYYTLLWNDPSGVDNGDVEVIFEYQQGASASLVKRLIQKFPASDSKNKAEFAVIGDDYFKGGRVLTWKATLRRGKRMIATRQSYLWQ